MGWSDSKAVSALFDFVFYPSSEIISKETPSLIASVRNNLTGGLVLGAMDSNDTNFDKNKEKTPQKDNGFIVEYDNALNKSALVEYYLKDAKIQSVDFYIGESLVTHDTTYPFYLGGDDKGKARGYQIDGTINLKVVVTFNNHPIYSVKTDSITIN